MADTPREVQFGQRLRDRRMECHLNQLKLAEKMKVPQTYISRWEAGNFEYMTLERLRKLKKILGISLDKLIGTEERRATNEEAEDSEIEPNGLALAGHEV